MVEFPYPCLLADVGGTNARFSMAKSAKSPLSPVIRLQTGEMEEFHLTVEKAIGEGALPRPRSLLVAVAGAVEGDTVTLTNAATARGLLSIDGRRLVEQLGLDQGILLNDFEALSMSLPFLPPESLLPIGGGKAVPGTPRMVIGPGTGLGVGALLEHGNCYLPVASEGGHVGIGPETAEDFALWPHLGAGRISGDDLLSGRGLTRLYRGLAQLHGTTILDDSPAMIGLRAIEGQEPLAVEAATRLISLLGRLAGDAALTFGALGGVYVGGGIAPRFASVMSSGVFRDAFEAKGLHRPYLAGIPVWLIEAADPAFHGLAAVAGNPASFMLDFRMRCWR